MGAKVVAITSDDAGAASIDVRLYGQLTAVALRLGTLSTPDITLTDVLTSVEILGVAGVAANTVWQPRVEVCDEDGAAIADAYDKPAVTGVLRVALAGAGAAKTGEIVLIF